MTPPNEWARPDLLVDTTWLADHLDDPQVRIVENAKYRLRSHDLFREVRDDVIDSQVLAADPQTGLPEQGIRPIRPVHACDRHVGDEDRV